MSNKPLILITNDDGVHFLGSGLGPGQQAPGGANTVLILEHDVLRKTLAWQFIPAANANSFNN